MEAVLPDFRLCREAWHFSPPTLSQVFFPCPIVKNSHLANVYYLARHNSYSWYLFLKFLATDGPTDVGDVTGDGCLFIQHFVHSTKDVAACAVSWCMSSLTTAKLCVAFLVVATQVMMGICFLYQWYSCISFERRTIQFSAKSRCRTMLPRCLHLFASWIAAAWVQCMYSWEIHSVTHLLFHKKGWRRRLLE